MSESPNPVTAALSMVRAMRVSSPTPLGTGTVDHAELADVLVRLKMDGVAGIASSTSRIRTYRAGLENVDPDRLSRPESLAYWLNLYNAGALDLAIEATGGAETSVLRIPGAFTRTWATVGDEQLSLNDIEHGKIRRFGDPRIHGALVCGSASCPTLRYEPYSGADLDGQLDTQMRSFLAAGGAASDGSRLLLSRIFLWYGGDFVRPHRMPTWIPASKTAIRTAIRPWLVPEYADLPVAFQSYDWGLSCSIG